MTEAWSVLPNSINTGARGGNGLRVCLLCFHWDALPKMLKKKRGGGWVEGWRGGGVEGLRGLFSGQKVFF